MPLPFLTARWSHLCVLTYTVPPELLRSRLPPGLELEMRDGRAFASLVAFQFLRTRLWGCMAAPWKAARDFAEWNLRFYVRHGAERGVVFVREFVPSRAVAWLARTLYNEPYVAAPLVGRVCDEPERLRAGYELYYAGTTARIELTGAKPGRRLPESSEDHFFKEHRWGFGVNRQGRTVRYEVRHPVWETLRVTDARVEVDWARLYGPAWAVMDGREPFSRILALGSPISVLRKRRTPAAGGKGPLLTSVT